ncbi:MAG: hypothetical protein A3J27_03925 [Candidatus Tectomicrobia bacterium RIFCSPLOWO2_12_FULL_69_37]|nr:MAG: hypothetical protein A3J27_03925 [Candidatus Tectomicrobia bacterium RIFCSPLOWO2_12_FULL_69_37]
MAQSRLQEKGRGRSAAFYAGLALWLLAVLAGAVAAWVLLGREKLPVYWKVPDFSLTERGGRKVTLADLKGKVWVANLVYTHCPDTCPFQTAEMAKLQKEFLGEKNFRLVTVTVDPERDTTEVLAEYAKKFGADKERWLFLTGKKEDIYELAQKGFHLSAAEPKGGAGKSGPGSFLKWLSPLPAYAHHPGPTQPYIHSSRFVLVDREARVRGTYMGIVAPSAEAKGPKGEFVPIYEEEVLRRLREDIRSVLREG